MRYSKAFIPTVKEAPKDAVVPSHVLLLRGGFIRMVGAGLYELLPLGMRVLRNVTHIVREEMDREGALEVLLPICLPSEYFKESGRWESFGDALFRLKDRKGGEYNLGPTHEEIVTDLARREIRSYRQMPVNIYQIQMKFRDEPRPRAGLLRCREFLMKDAYSFDVSEEAAKESYEHMRRAYTRIFTRLGLSFRMVQANSGSMGGTTSAEFQILAENGEDAIVACGECEYAANLEIAEARPESSTSDEPLLDHEPIVTPGAGGIDDVVKFIGGEFQASQMLKCLFYTAKDGSTVMAVVRGDHEVNEAKLANHLGVAEVQLATEQLVQKITHAKLGFAGPVGYKGRIVVDGAATQVRNAVTGANKTDTHLKNVNYSRDYTGEVIDIRAIEEGDPCPRCQGTLQLHRGIEGGHIFILGTHYSTRMNASFVDETGDMKPIVMGCYGIGISRIVAAAVEQNHDKDGIVWPAAIAPYTVIVTSLGTEAIVAETAEQIYTTLQAEGVDVLYDDRDERPGVKLKDADLIGIPFRIVVGARSLAEGQVELVRRATKEVEKVVLDQCVPRLKALLQAL